MSNNKVDATFHPDDAEKRAEQARVAEARGKRQEPTNPMISMDPEDPTAVPHAHMDEH
jgi:hypothetical protein